MGPLKIQYEYIPIVGTGIFSLVMISLFIYVIMIQLNEQKKEFEFDKQLKFSIDPLAEQKEKESKLAKITEALPKLLIKSKILKEDTDLQYAKKKVFMYSAILFLFCALIFKNPMGGVIPLVFSYGALFGIANYRISKARDLLNEQIPAFVSIFKANIQANQYPQNAMINAIDNTASPLLDELARPRSIMEAGEFRSGIISLRMTTENETLRQMASCIELASTSGSNIEEQIVIIESIIKDKQSLERKKKLGVNENKPLFIVSALMVPMSFIGSYLMSDMHKDYWFTTAFSYAIIIGIVGVMALASWFTWKIIKKIDVG